MRSRFIKAASRCSAARQKKGAQFKKRVAHRTKAHAFFQARLHFCTVCASLAGRPFFCYDSCRCLATYRFFPPRAIIHRASKFQERRKKTVLGGRGKITHEIITSVCHSARPRPPFVPCAPPRVSFERFENGANWERGAQTRACIYLSAVSHGHFRAPNSHETTSQFRNAGRYE